MRGGTQALLVRDRAGNSYIAKCVGNPQGTRTLVNEWIISRLLKHLRVSTPAVHLLHIEPGIPGDHLLEFQLGNRKVPICSGVHLGSACPVDPDRRAIFDFVPRSLLHKVVNLPDLLMSFAFDKWVNQADARQAIFIRERSAEPGVKFRTYLIDHGLSFGGSRWEISDTAALNGLFPDRFIYSDPALESECHAMVDRIQNLPETSLFSIMEEIPSEWLETTDREDMSRLLQLLSERRNKLHLIVERALRQLHENGTIISKSAEAKALLGALLLLAGLSRTLATLHDGDIKTSEVQEVPITQPGDKNELRLAANLNFLPRIRLGKLGRMYNVQIWQNSGHPHSDSPIGSHSPGSEQYLFRIYSRKKAASKHRLVGEYACFFNRHS